MGGAVRRVRARVGKAVRRGGGLWLPAVLLVVAPVLRLGVEGVREWLRRADDVAVEVVTSG